MRVYEVFNWINATSESTHPYYYPIQGVLCASLTYFSVSLLTSIPADRATAIITLAFAIDKVVAVLFIELLTPFEKEPAVKYYGQLLPISVAVICSKNICALAGYNLSLMSLMRAYSTFLLASHVARWAYVYLYKKICRFAWANVELNEYLP